jgi:hypothetical protein
MLDIFERAPARTFGGGSRKRGRQQRGGKDSACPGGSGAQQATASDFGHGKSPLFAVWTIASTSQSR